MAAMAVHCSQRERRAEEAERDVDERFKCAWMAKHVGSEFDGTVTGVTSFGLFVELEESKVSGLVHISQLSNDYYHFDPVRHLLKGERTGVQFRLGDHVRVQVLRASLEDRKIDFRLVPPKRSGAPAGCTRRTCATTMPRQANAIRCQGRQADCHRCRALPGRRPCRWRQARKERLPPARTGSGKSKSPKANGGQGQARR